MIKNVKPSGKHIEGLYKVINESKYLGDPSKVIYRSSYERKFAMFCDNNINIIKWGSEIKSIPYKFDNKHRRYYPDFFIKMNVKGEILTFLVEVKPSKFLKKPKTPKRKTAKALNRYKQDLYNYAKNVAKFKAAKAFCKMKGWRFWIVDEPVLKQISINNSGTV